MVPTDEELRSILEYDPGSGEIRWKVRTGAKSKVGTVAGSLDSKGYVVIRVKGATHKAHRLAFLLHTGAWPEKQVDHVNGVKADNRWSNLRDVDSVVNMGNRGLQSNNTTGFRGVTERAGGRFQASLQSGKTRKVIGTFDTAEEAGAAYKAAKGQEKVNA